MEVTEGASVLIKVRISKAKEDIGPEVMDCLSKIEGILYVEVCE